MRLLPCLSHWLPISDANPEGRRLYHRHYSSRKAARGWGVRRPAKFIGPGFYTALLTTDGQALFVWRKFVSDDVLFGSGVNCSIFRNESRVRSSTLILEAEEHAWRRWPGERLYTYVNPREVQSSNPGWCFICAGWRHCGWTKGGLRVLEKLP